MLSLHQLRCFLATYEHGSLTGAAEELGYAQPSVSEQVRLLERSVGSSLFRRVGRGVVPTTVAETLRPHAERTLAAAEEAMRVAQSATALETGTIRGRRGGACLDARGGRSRATSGGWDGRVRRSARACAVACAEGRDEGVGDCL